MAKSVRKFSQTLDLRKLPTIRLRSHRYFPIAMVIAAFLALACIHIWQRVQVMTLVHETALLREERRQLVDAANKVHDEIAALSLASRIERYATDTLGMVRVPGDRLFTLQYHEESVEPLNELARVFTSIRRVADNLPAVAETQASAGEVPQFLLDPEELYGEDEEGNE
ncbi:hypothetical protein GF420_04920 [candidate division GN15 bacterium]|nr:hypothetical protein [candidate division GN15 bacterium]